MPKAIALFVVMLIGAGCATKQDRIILLPDENGKVGAIAVLDKNSKETVIKSAYAEATVSDSGAVKSATTNRQTVRSDFSRTLAAQPPAPASYMMYFQRDSDNLVAESETKAREILQSIAERPAADVVLVGHTDSVGEGSYNDKLSLARASAVREKLIGFGLAPGRITIAGRGERQLLIPTKDEVSEPRNRRVELKVR